MSGLNKNFLLNSLLIATCFFHIQAQADLPENLPSQNTASEVPVSADTIPQPIPPQDVPAQTSSEAPAAETLPSQDVPSDPPLQNSPNTSGDKQNFYQALSKMTLPPKERQAAPQGVPDGPYKAVMEDGQEYKTFVNNGYFDKYMVVYYPNFVTYFRADMVDGLFDDWVTFYLPTGYRSHKVLFRKGLVQEAIVYNESGSPTYYFWFENEQPIQGAHYDVTGKQLETMF